LDQGYLGTNPASATIRLDALDDDLLAAIASHPEVGAAEARRTLSGRIKAGPVEWRGLTLFVVRDFSNLRVSTLAPQQGAWPPATGEILIERDAVRVAHARIGDSLLLRINGGKEQALRFTGTVKDVGQAQARMENIVYGYITLDTLGQLVEAPYLDQLKLQVARNRFDEPHIRRVVDEVKALIEGRGKTVKRVDIPEPGAHPHSRIMGLLLLSMSSFGIFVLLLSSILVVNLLTSLMAAQVRQIGVMKALGGTRRQIASIYFGQALLLGVAAILASCPLGILGSRLLCRYLAVFLNFDITSFAVPIWVYLLVAAVGLVVPLLAAAWPVWKGTGIPVREALADYGVGPRAFGTGAFDRALAGIGGAARPLLLAIRNSFRRRTRLALTLVTLGAGGLFFMSALNVRASLINTLDRLFATKQFDLAVNLGAMQPFEKAARAARNTPGVQRVEGWVFAEASIASGEPRSGEGHATAETGGLHGGGGEKDAPRFSVVALPADTRMLKPDLAEGRALLPDDSEAVIVVNTALAASSKDKPLRAGDQVTLRMGSSTIAWRVVGIAQEPFSPPTGYIPLRFLEREGGHTGMANSLRLSLDQTDSASINRIRASLDRNLELEGVRAQSSSSKADSRFGFDQHMVMIYLFLIIMSCILAGVGGLGLMTTMSLNVLERRREMGVLRAIGAAPSMVQLIVVVEGAVIGLLSWFVAALLAWPVGRALGNLLVSLLFKNGLAFLFDPTGLWIWLAVSICLGAFASFVPAWRASRRPVREAIGYE
ncbi:MAG: FtsX-like permease family protein, partial [Blastocatellia bacterium]|nr:FtsX-like permease family protein [Blastocatellia bacterium]